MIALLSSLHGTPARADDATVSAKTFNVVGVRLGMTPAQVLAALRAYDPSLHLQKFYYCNGGAADSGICAHYPKPQPLSLIRTDPDYMPTPARYYGDSITVAFSQTPGLERVVGVQFTRTYDQAHPHYPAASVVDKNLEAKFPANSRREDFSGQTGSGLQLGYFIDRQGQHIPNDSDNAQANFARTLFQLPVTDQRDYGVSFVGQVYCPPETPGLVQSVRLALFDENALYTAAAVERPKIDQMILAAKVSSAEKNSGNTKF
jgi:hypothetical protein